MAGFQKAVTIQPTYAVEGDFASSNPYATLLNSPEDGLSAGTGGAVVGRFGWVNQINQTVSNAGATAPDGFISRNYNALINTLSDESSMTIPAGVGVGAQLPVSQNAYVYGDVRYERSFGSGKREAYRGTLGFKYTWK